MSENTALHVAIVEYLDELLKNPGNLDIDSLEVAAQCLTEALQVDVTSEKHQPYLLAPKNTSLAEILEKGHSGSPSTTSSLPGFPGDAAHWNAYLQSKLDSTEIFVGSEDYTNKVKEIGYTYQKEFNVKLHAVITGEISDEDKTKGEEYKTQGNNFLSQGDLFQAIEYYTKAIQSNPEHHIYFANRAVAYFKLNRYQDAINDCNSSIKLNGKYSKSHYRLGQCYTALQRYDEALAAFHRAADVARENNELNLVTEIEQQRKVVENKKLGRNPQQQQQQQQPQAQANPFAALGGLGGGGAGGAGGFDLSSIMNNPMFANLMQNMGGMMGGGAGGQQQPQDDDDDYYDDDDEEYDDDDDMGDDNTSGAGAGAAGTDGLMAGIQQQLASNPQLAQSIQNDPELAAALQDIQQNGVAAGLKYLSNPNIMQKLSPLLGGMFGGAGAGAGGVGGN